MTKEQMRIYLEEILEKEGIEFTDPNMDDDDINFKITFNGEQYLNKFKTINAFLCYQPEKEKLMVVKPRFYKFQNDENEEMKLKIANEINEIISGKVIYDDEENYLWYVYNKDTTIEKITNASIQLVVLDIIIALGMTIKMLIKEMKDEN